MELRAHLKFPNVCVLSNMFLRFCSYPLLMASLHRCYTATFPVSPPGFGVLFCIRFVFGFIFGKSPSSFHLHVRFVSFLSDFGAETTPACTRGGLMSSHWSPLSQAAEGCDKGQLLDQRQLSIQQWTHLTVGIMGVVPPPCAPLLYRGLWLTALALSLHPGSEVLLRNGSSLS